MKILAVDQSYTSSGIVILDDSTIVFAERFTTNASHDTYLRAWTLTRHLIDVAEEHNVDAIVVEGLAFAKFGNATRDLAGLQYVIVTALRHVYEYEVHIIPPNTVKKVATGKGNADKKLMVEKLPPEHRQVFDDLGVKKTTGLYDLTDAYWLAVCGRMKQKKLLIF